MLGKVPHDQGDRDAEEDLSLPRPSLQFRLKAWRTFQRALDPLAPPKPFRPPQQRQH